VIVANLAGLQKTLKSILLQACSTEGQEWPQFSVEKTDGKHESAVADFPSKSNPSTPAKMLNSERDPSKPT
jgi:hypothetical protein